MNFVHLKTIISAALLVICIPLAGFCAEFKYPVGLTYASGPQQVVDKLKENYEIEGDSIWPVGISFNPYFQFDNGLGIGASLGPTMIMIIDKHDSSSDYNFIIPIGLDLRYTLFAKSSISPYLRGGFRYPITSGDFFSSDGPGGFGAVGMEFWRNKRVGLGIEVSYDSSEVEVKAGGVGSKPGTHPQKATSSGFMVGVSAVF